MSPLHEFPEFFHPARRVGGKIRVHVIVVSYGIRRSRLPFHELRIRRSTPGRCRLRGMSDDAGVPDMSTAQPLEIFKGRAVNVRQSAGSVFLKRASAYTGLAVIAPKAREHLIYDRFLHRLFDHSGPGRILCQ